MRLIKKYYLFFLALALGCSIIILQRVVFVSPVKLVSNCQEKLIELEHEAKSGLNYLQAVDSGNQVQSLFLNEKINSDRLFTEKGIVYLIYDKDSLVFWSDQAPSVENYRKEICLDNSLVRLRNGWFEVIQHPNNNLGTKNYLALILLKHEYSYQNKFLNNDFPAWFGLPDKTRLIEYSSGQKENLIYSGNGTPLVQLQFVDLPAKNMALINSLNFLYLVFFILLLFLIRQVSFIVFRKRKKFIRFAAVVAFVLIIRVLMVWLKLPSSWHETSLFNAAVFGDASSFFFGYLGDVLIDSVLFLTGAYFLNRIFSKSAPVHVRYPVFFSSALLLFLLLLSFGINRLVISLVQNSHISFRINEVFTLTYTSFVGLFSIGMIFLAFYFVTVTAVQLMLNFGLSKKKLGLLLIGGALCHGLILFFTYAFLEISFAWIWGFVVLVLFLKEKDWSYSFFYGLPFILFFSLLSAFLFYEQEQRKELELRKVYAQDLSNQQDDVAENLFVDISRKIKNDNKLKRIVFSHPVNAIDLEQRIRQQYFSGYWEKFDVLLSVVDSACSPLLKTDDPVHGNNTYFDQQIENSGRPTIADGLYFIENTVERIRYISRIKIEHPAGKQMKPAVLYAELEPKLAGEISGFPELLLDKKVKTNSKLNDYSFAIYINQRLTARFGKYNFKNTFSRNIAGDFTHWQEDGYDHLVYANGLVRVMLSLPLKTWRDQFSFFSCFFSFYSLLLVLVFIMQELFFKRIHVPSSLNFRVQLLLVSVVLVSLFSFGLGTYFVIKRQHENQNAEALNQLSRTIREDTQEKLAAAEQLSDNYRDYVAYLLKKVSTVFLSDVSLYDLNGNLVASSQPRLFDEGILSRKMNPRARFISSDRSDSHVVLEENIGRLTFNSSYQLFYNREGKHIGFINLPYFAKKEQQEKEITLSVAALVNSYVILFTVSIIVALLISNLVTKPLRVLQQKFSVIRFGSRNELIEWQGNDEISALVDEYNRMVIQLEESAALLAKSEREGAWREMAKQVAHEIKNPLTPMKLNIQQLQRTIHTTDIAELSKRIETLSAMLVEQIDTLSAIASEFSAFAQMPRTNLEELRISDLVIGVIQLFSDNEKYTIHLNELTDGKQLVLADKDQCKRIFTNLIKNAIQSIPENRLGQIHLALHDKGKTIEVVVSDNGTGIPEEVQSKIFAPNFSTKTDGMGLGLAMVKNSIESFGGTISFKTQLDVGTSFILELPKQQLN